MRGTLPIGRLAGVALAIGLASAAVGVAAEAKPRPVRCLAFSPDGKELAAAYGSAPSSGEVVVWDLEKRRSRFAYAEKLPDLAVAYSPDGETLAVGGFQSSVKLLDAATGALRHELKGHRSLVRAVAFSPDGALLASASGDRTVRLWDAASGEAKSELKCPHALRWVAFNPDGKWLAAAGPEDHFIRLWQVESPEMPPRDIALENGILHAAFSPDGGSIAVADAHGPLVIFAVETGNEIARHGDLAALHWVAFSPDGKWLAGAPAALGILFVPPGQRASLEDKRREIDVLLGQLPDNDPAKRDAATRRLAAFGKLAAPQITAALDRSDAEANDRCRLLLEQMHGGDFSDGISDLEAIPECLAFSPDGKLLACGDWHGGIRLWRVGTWNLTAKLTRENFGPPTKIVSEYSSTIAYWLSVQPPLPLVLPQPGVATIDAMEEFRRDLRDEAWDHAFARLERLQNETSPNLLAEEDGFRVPQRVSLFRILAQVPPAGKATYRLLYDAQARGIWEELQQQEGAIELAMLTRLATIDLPTSVGDLAADRLGDVLFEQGKLEEAVEAWQRVLEHRPDSALRPAALLVKTATALARGERWQQFAEVRGRVERRFADDMVFIGGRKQRAAEYLAQLADAQPKPAENHADTALVEFNLPRTQTPLWQFQLDALAPNGANGDDAGRAETDLPAIISGDRLYATARNRDFSLDLASGNPLWSVPRIEMGTVNSGIQFSGLIQWTANHEQLWVTAPSAGRYTSQGRGGATLTSTPLNFLLRIDPSDGRAVWTLGNLGPMAAWAPVGSPLFDDGVLYCCANRIEDSSMLYLLAWRIGDRRLLWSTMIGSYQLDWRNMVTPVFPLLVRSGKRLYVDLQANELLEIDAAGGAIRWAYYYEPDPPKSVSNSPGPPPSPMLLRPSPPLVDGDMLYVKPAASAALRVIRASEPRLAWKHTAPYGARPVAVDSERVYLAGDDVSAYDLKTQKLTWRNRLPKVASWSQPLVTRNGYFQFVSGGVVEIDKTSGETVRTFAGADADSSGGKILLTPKLMLTVSSRAITAYRLDGIRGDREGAQD